MPKRIQVENQVIEFPDEMPDNEIEAVIKREFYSQPQQSTPAPLQAQPSPAPTPQQELPKMGRGEAFLTTATNFPLAPRVKAGISALTAKGMGGDESIGQFYDEALGNELKKLRTAREQYPYQSFASQLAGDIAVGGTALKAAKLGGNTIKQVVAGGSLLGGLSAAGETEADLASPQGATDIATGGVVGAVGGIAGRQLGKAINQSVPVAKDIMQRFRKTTPDVVASRIIPADEALQESTKLAGKIQEGRITTLPEQGNENVLALTRLLGKTQGSNKIIKDYIENKTAGSAKRVGDIVNKNISAEGFFDTLDNTIAKRKELSTPLYKQAEVEGEKYLKKFLKTKKVIVNEPVVGNDGMPKRDPATGATITKKVLQEGKKKYLYDNPNIDVYIKAAKNEPLFVDPRLSNNSFVVLKGAKEMIDRDIQRAVANGDRASSSALIGIKKQVLNILEKASPSYKEANKIFASESSLINSQKEGLKFNQYRNGEEVKRAFSKLSDGEKETFRIGVKDYLLDKVAKSSDRNPAKAIYGNQLERRKLQALFDNPKQFTDFTKRLNDEIRVFDTKQRILGGSRTDYNMEEQAQLLDKVARGAINVKTFGASDIILLAKDAIKRKYYGLNEQTAKELARTLTNPQESVALLNRIYQKAQTDAERGLIQKFTQDYLSKINYTSRIAPQMGRAMATEQLKKEENNNGI